MQNNPLVSVVMPAYNVDLYIAQAVESVINQTYNNWELVIVDDCSTDKTSEIVSNIAITDPRIKLVTLEKNLGRPSKVKNVALSFCQGEFVAFLDSDDWWVDNKLEIQVGHLVSDPQCSLLYSGAYWTDHAGNVIKEVLPYQKNSTNIFVSLQRKYDINNQTVIIRADVLKDVGIFNPEIVIGEDYDLFMRIAARYKIRASQLLLTYYRRHESSLTAKKNKLSLAVNGLEQTYDTLLKLNQISDKDLIHLKRKINLMYARISMLNGKEINAREHLLKCFSSRDLLYCLLYLLTFIPRLWVRVFQAD